MRGQGAVQALTNGLALGLLLWWLLDADGQGEARVWRALSAAFGALAFEFGQMKIVAEARYWEAVRP